MNRVIRCAGLLLLLFTLSVGATDAGLVDFSPGLLKFIRAQWGGDAIERLEFWRTRELEGLKVRSEESKKPSNVVSLDELSYFNTFWNRLPYVLDREHWGVDDFWATPVEALASNGADCEDYSVAKYFSLKALGIKPEQLRITYVFAHRNNRNREVLDEAHMVLAYYPTPESEPFILDNLTGKLLPASEREDLEPIYSFNDDDMWIAGGASAKGKSSQIRLWTELLEKMAAERRM